MKSEIYKQFHYKNGGNVSHAEHLKTTTWHRGVNTIQKSKKDFTCVFGCNIPKGSSYVTLEMMAGNGRADSIIDFALCQFHQFETEEISGALEQNDHNPSELLDIWSGLMAVGTQPLSTPVRAEVQESSLGTLPEEVAKPEKYFEGATRTIYVNVYERNKKARDECIKAHGHACVVCGLNFELEYGEIGKEYIHVHHLKQLADINQEYELNPERDLRPVCPNCHAMLHRKRPAYSVEELREIRHAVNK